MVFICNHCPYVKAVIDRMVSDARVLMSESIGFAAICSNDAASYAETHLRIRSVSRRLMISRFHISTTRSRQSLGRMGSLSAGLFGDNADRKLKYRGRLDEGRTTPPSAGAPRELVEAMRAIATTGLAPADQKASIGCSIKWKGE